MLFEASEKRVKPALLLPEKALTADLIGRIASASLLREVMLSPKPGLVSPIDSGSHRDMNLDTFLLSINALQDYFPAIAHLGASGSGFDTLRDLGISAELKMRKATGGINTHKGAIFSIGLLSAAAGALAAKKSGLTAKSVCSAVAAQWGAEILDSAGAAVTHGTSVKNRHGCGGARSEAAAGFPTVLSLALPAYKEALGAGASRRLAAVQCLFTLIAALDDTNLLWRRGAAGLDFAKSRARDFLTKSGVFAPRWEEHARVIHSEFVARNLSPGGSADLLGVTLFLEDLENAAGHFI